MWHGRAGLEQPGRRADEALRRAQPQAVAPAERRRASDGEAGVESAPPRPGGGAVSRRRARARRAARRVRLPRPARAEL